jgi:hypothetical protein
MKSSVIAAVVLVILKRPGFDGGSVSGILRFWRNVVRPMPAGAAGECEVGGSLGGDADSQCVAR